MSKSIDRFYVWGFVGVLAAAALLFLLSPKQSFSESENRYLQKTPIFSWERLLTKELSEDVELYISDHFPFRTEWVSLKSMTEQLRLQKENNGIYIGQDGWLFEKYAAPDDAKLSSYIEAVKLFAEKQAPASLTFLLAPTSIGLYEDRLPWLASVYPQQAVNEQIGLALRGSLSFLDGFEIFHDTVDSSRPLYYRTDHHWTTYGAYVAYRAYAESMGWEPLAESAFRIKTVTENFYGSYHTKGQFSGIQPDSLQIYEPKQPLQLEVHNIDKGTVSYSLYDEDGLTKKDKYAYFQGGVHALLQVYNKSGDTDINKLLLIKDSYAHSILPFLAHHAEEIHMIDIRFYNGSISGYMEQQGIEHALLLFNTATLTQENSMLKLKY